MSDRVLVNPDYLSDIADAIRAKNGESGTYTPAQMADAIAAITTGDAIDHEDLPAYVKAEALDVAERVKARLKSDSIVFIAGSDSHQSTTAHVEDGNLHGGMSMKALAYLLPLDFACYLGDYTNGSSTTTLAQGRQDFKEINADIDEAFRGLPQFRTVGNHDPLGYSYTANGNTALTQAELYQLIGKYNAESGATMGEATPVAGYCCRDFAAKHLRVICLNTADQAISEQGGAEAVSAAQKTWFADTLISTPNGYGIIILAHHPLDWGNIMACSHILRAYVEEQSGFVIGGVTYDFTGKNKSAWQLQIHGHVHTFTVDDLHWNDGGTGVAYNVKRIAVPNLCFVRNNEYGSNTGPEYYNIEFGTTTTYSKTADSGKDTAWCVFVINPSDKLAYAINYGAGIDRMVSFDYTKTYYSITPVLSHVTMVGDSLVEPNDPYTATLTPDTGYEFSTVTVTMGGTDITSTAFNSQTGAVSIAAVTGNVTITAAATVIVPYHNKVPTSTDENGSVYNTTGYKTGYRLNSSGGETAGTSCIVCGYIPYGGEVIRAGYFSSSAQLSWSGNYLCFYDSNKSFIRSVAGNTTGSSLSNQIWTYDPDAESNATVKADVLRAAYVRVSFAAYQSPADAFTVTLDETF